MRNFFGVFLREFQSLINPESVLFVHNHKRQVFEFNFFLNQRVRAD